MDTLFDVLSDEVMHFTTFCHAVVSLSLSLSLVMFHGPPPTKIKREVSPSKELSPCSQDCSPMPYGEKCLYSYR